MPYPISTFQEYRTIIAIASFMIGLLVIGQEMVALEQTIYGLKLFACTFLPAALLVLCLAGFKHWRHRITCDRTDLGEYVMLAIGVGLLTAAVMSYWNRTGGGIAAGVEQPVIAKASGRGSYMIEVNWEGSHEQLLVPWELWKDVQVQHSSVLLMVRKGRLGYPVVDRIRASGEY